MNWTDEPGFTATARLHTDYRFRLHDINWSIGYPQTGDWVTPPPPPCGSQTASVPPRIPSPASTLWPSVVPGPSFCEDCQVNQCQSASHCIKSFTQNVCVCRTSFFTMWANIIHAESTVSSQALTLKNRLHRSVAGVKREHTDFEIVC